MDIVERLREENDVLKYQYEAMKNETVRCKGLFDQLVKEQELEKEETVYQRGYVDGVADGYEEAKKRVRDV